MKLSRGMKILLGIGTIWPLCYLIFFFVFMFVMMGSLLAQANMRAASPGPFFPGSIMMIIPFHLLTMLIVIGLIVFYIVYVVKSERLDQTMKIVWIVLFFMGGLLAMPIFYFIYIWRDPATNSPLPTAG